MRADGAGCRFGCPGPPTLLNFDAGLPHRHKIMRITWNEFTVNLAGQNPDELLSDWRWLIGDALHLFMVSSCGDMFLSDRQGHVFWLDSGTGQLQQIANSVAEFHTLRQQRQNSDQWFMPQLVGDLMARGRKLGPGECYSYKKPPILGGQIEPPNFEPTDLSVHFSILGQIHKQVKDLPPGTKISKINIDEP